MDINEITGILIELELYWQKNRTPILEKLAPGIEINVSDMKNFTGKLPPEAFDVYRWKNGIRAGHANDLIGTLSLFELGIFLSFDEVVVIQNEMGNDEFGWENTKLPLFESGGGEYFLIDCDPSKDSYGRIFYHSIGAVEFKRMISIYDSLYTLFIAIYKANKAGIYKYEKEKGMLIIEKDKSFDNCKAHNPLSDFNDEFSLHEHRKIVS